MKKHWILLVTAVAIAGSSSVARADSTGTTGAAEATLVNHDTAVQEAARKKELVDAILAARKAASGRDLGAAHHSLMSGLMSHSIEELEAMQTAGALGVVANAIGDTAADLLFTPVAPCRVIDTRSAAAGVLVAGSQRHFLVRNAGGFAAQGGSATDCGIPANATAVAMNLVAVGAAAPGNLRAYAFGTPVPNASVINYAPVPGALLNLATGAVQPVCDPAGATPCTNDLSIQTDAGNTHLVVDVVGYLRRFPKPIDVAAANFTNTVPAQGTAPISLATLTFTPVYSGTVIASGGGHCNMVPIATGENGVNIAAGLDATSAFSGADFQNWGITRVLISTAFAAGGTFQQAWFFEKAFAVTAGTPMTLSLFGRHEAGATTSTCRGSFKVRQLL